MKRRLFLSALAVLAVCSSCTKKKVQEADTQIPVRVTPVKSSTVHRQLSYSANLEAFERVYFAPTLAGTRIKKIYVEVGDRVSKGQLLVEMDATSYMQQEIQFKNIELEYNRAVKLMETGSISQQNYDKAVTQYEVAKTALQNLKENTRMVAPFNGVVTGKFMEDGELYSGGAFGGATKPSIISIEQISPMKAYVAIAENYYNEIKKGMKVELESEVYKGRTFEGRVNIVYPTINPQSRTFQVELLFDNKDEALRPGMYGTININVGETEAVVVQSISVLKVQGSNDRYLFVIRDGKAKRISVSVLNRYEDKVEVKALDDVLNEGDMLVCAGQARLVDGSEVNIVTE